MLSNPGVNLGVRLHEIGRGDGIAPELIEGLLLEHFACQTHAVAKVR
ncbi:hypothetical protein PF007_g24659 [Phytophthora fragariae]|uniref:Uncharacterized protein n=1 Tax=Phytophthora fragariae TaxID=53985 RepID=A0A6A3REY7_9STRA|nr:hypothetical protein PF009_g25450 [Phytophthora fragariae]KAE9076352.1 hypothetical protein PF007_g24659 [Phytophthora fragariae]KAE9095712.1 hypothetical protein PF006_g23947 [Phytophthora fragariae]